MTITEQEKLDILEKLEIIIDQDEYIDNSEIRYSEESWKLEYKTWDLLIQLLSSVSLNKELEEFLIKAIFSSNINSYRLLFYASCNYWLLDNFLDFYTKSNFQYLNHKTSFIKIYFEWFNYFSKFFNKKQLWKHLNILKIEKDYSYRYNIHYLEIASSDLIKKIINHRFNELSENLIWINIEINKDKEEVKEIINYFWFDDKYNEFLTTLDKHFYSENKDSIEMAWLIWTFRQFNSDIIIDIASEVAKIELLEDIPKIDWSKSTSKIWIAWDYLKERFQLTKNEEKFLEYFTKILHEEWWHAFLSSIEYFRLTKNITIEIILLLLYKLKDFKENNK